MHSRFDRFRTTALGQQLETLINTPERYIEFAALSRAGVAAIAAVKDEIAEKFPEIEDDTTARQFCGAMTADVMRRYGHEVVQSRGRVGGALFSYGAVFSPLPILLPFAEVIGALATMPTKLTEAVSRIPAVQWLQRPTGTGFALVEHACHLRDLDAVFAARIRAVRSSSLPLLESVDGTVWAAERHYLRQDLNEAVTAFEQSRQHLCAELKRLKPAQLKRCGLRDGVRRMTLEDLVREMLDHDRTHCLELDELCTELLQSTARSSRRKASV
ncbi:damage-inducible protein DinB [Paraburkholderia acidicola]|uniref:Damage-inducible protein DinB n=1 Tax=Paraburkholderia acidicola TaxID=1912599 RepID=A0A2A4ENB5_9BURK|nr:DinB family protein [Paraburkholderia acidicola]PCE22631.1 damage-inducible protein DinB [Paraburkholderia acidicola]